MHFFRDCELVLRGTMYIVLCTCTRNYDVYNVHRTSVHTECTMYDVHRIRGATRYYVQVYDVLVHSAMYKVFSDCLVHRTSYNVQLYTVLCTSYVLQYDVRTQQAPLTRQEEPEEEDS